MPRQIQARILADANGPGPFCALMYKKNADPRKRKMALTTEGCSVDTVLSDLKSSVGGT